MERLENSIQEESQENRGNTMFRRILDTVTLTAAAICVVMTMEGCTYYVVCAPCKSRKFGKMALKIELDSFKKDIKESEYRYDKLFVEGAENTLILWLKHMKKDPDKYKKYYAGTLKNLKKILKRCLTEKDPKYKEKYAPFIPIIKRLLEKYKIDGIKSRPRP